MTGLRPNKINQCTREQKILDFFVSVRILLTIKLGKSKLIDYLKVNEKKNLSSMMPFNNS